MGLIEILTLIFVTLKLTGHIDWSWLAVFSPVLIVWTLYAIILWFVVSLHSK
jgi:hypothetical protein